MTTIRGYIAPTKDSDAHGVHSLDQFLLAVPDTHVASASLWRAKAIR